MKLEEIFVFMLNNSITAGWVILAVVLLRILLKKAPRRIICLLWLFPALRLALPFSVQSVLSLVPSAKTVPQEILTAPVPAINTNIPGFDNVVNPLLAELTPAPDATVNPMQIIMYVLGIVYILGIFVILAVSAYKSFRINISIRDAVHYEKTVWFTDNVDTPFVTGIIRPKIILPYSLPEKDREYVIDHEEEHIRRNDNLSKLVGFALFTAYWFNPLVWLGYVLFCRDMELACDEAVISMYDTVGRKNYSFALLNCASRQRLTVFCPTAFGEISVKERIKNVLNFKKPTIWLTFAALIICAGAAVCLMTDPVKADSETPPPQGATQELSADDIFFNEDLWPMKKDEVIEKTNIELEKMYNLGIFSNKFTCHPEKTNVFYNSNEFQNSHDTRICGSAFAVSSGDQGSEYYLNLSLDEATGKIYRISVVKYTNEGEKPLADKEPIEIETADGMKTVYYYDDFADVMPENISVNDLCKKLNEYWGFKGFTIGATKFDDYGYDEKPYDPKTKIKDLADKPWLTVYFDGDNGEPMFVEINFFPGQTIVNIGTSHSVG